MAIARARRRLLFVLASVATASVFVALASGCTADELGDFVGTSPSTDASVRFDGRTADASCNLGSSRIVDLPSPGMSSDPSSICASLGSTILSPDSARVSLGVSSAGPQASTGLIEIPAAIQAAMVGGPTIELVSASWPTLEAMVISDMAKVTKGYLFQAKWPRVLPEAPTGPHEIGCATAPRLSLEVTLTLDCKSDAATPSDADSGMKTVVARTEIELCADGRSGDKVFLWARSGEECCTRCTFASGPEPPK